MANITQEIEEFIQLDSQEKDSFTAAEIISAQKKKMQDLQYRIRGGDTTGDRIKDFVISRYGVMSDKIEEIYRNIDTKIGQHEGEFILMVSQTERFHGCVGFGYEPRNSEYSLDKHFYLGILNSNSLVLNSSEASCDLPTKEHLLCYRVYNEKLEPTEGNIPVGFSHDFGYFLNQPLSCKNSFNSYKNPLHLELKVGDREVQEWFQNSDERYQAYLKKATELFGHEIQFSPSFA